MRRDMGKRKFNSGGFQPPPHYHFPPAALTSLPLPPPGAPAPLVLSDPGARRPSGGSSSAGSMRTCSTGCRIGSIACPTPWACDDRPSNTRSLKAWMGATHFLTRTLDKVRTEMSLHVLAYNLKRMITIFGAAPLMAAIRT